MGPWQFIGVLPLFDPALWAMAKSTIAYGKAEGCSIKNGGHRPMQLAIAKETSKKVLGLAQLILDASQSWAMSSSKRNGGQLNPSSNAEASPKLSLNTSSPYLSDGAAKDNGHFVGNTGWNGVNDGPLR